MNNPKHSGHPTLILEDVLVFPGHTPPMPGLSVAIYEDRILAVGPHREVAQLASNHTERLNLKGRSLVPGFIDSHTCFATDCQKVDQIQLEGKPLSAVDLAERLLATAKDTEPGKWVVVKGYTEESSHTTRLLSALDIDRVLPHFPVAVIAKSMNLCILNRLGMDAIHLTSSSLDISDVQIERDKDLKPTGRLRGTIERILPDGFPCHEVSSLKRRMQKLGNEYLQRGITTIHDIDIYRTVDMAAYFALRKEHSLPLRVVAMLRGFPRDDSLRTHYMEIGLGTGFGDSWLKLGAMKFSIDGLMGRQAAAVSNPWVGTPGNYGQLYFSEEEIVQIICRVTEAGFQIAFHANGDRAISSVLRSLKKARSLVGRPILRPRIHHCTLPNPENIREIKETGAIPIGHPHFIRYMGDAHLSGLGEVRMKMGYFPFRAFLNQGIPAVLSAEPILPVDRIHPMIGISAAMTRKTLEGRVLDDSQRITLEEAIQMYTYNPAYSAFEEKRKGSIETGKLADMAVLETDLRGMSPEELAEVQVDYTILNGQIVFTRT